MFNKTYLNWTNMVSEASCPDRLNPCVKHVSIWFVAILNEWGITPIRRDKKKSSVAQICKNITHNRYRKVFRAKINAKELYLLDKKFLFHCCYNGIFQYVIAKTAIVLSIDKGSRSWFFALNTYLYRILIIFLHIWAAKDFFLSLLSGVMPHSFSIATNQIETCLTHGLSRPGQDASLTILVQFRWVLINTKLCLYFWRIFGSLVSSSKFISANSWKFQW